MEMRELRYFVALAEELHFARAAARIGIEQSPLSKAITVMERHLGVRLFIRTRRSTTLTPIGETLLRDARRILAQVDFAHRNLLAAAAGHSGRLHVAMCDGVAHLRIGRLLANIRKGSPDVDIQVSHIPISEQLRGLRSGQIDVGFGLSPSDDPQLRCVPLWKDHVVIVMRRDDPLADRLSIGRPALRDSPLILLGERFRQHAPNADLAGLTMNGKAVQYVASMELLLTLVTAGYGIGLISAGQADTIRRPDLAMHALDPGDAAITTFMVQRSEADSALVAQFTMQARMMS